MTGEPLGLREQIAQIVDPRLKADPPLKPGCDCYVCVAWTAALYKADEIISLPALATRSLPHPIEGGGEEEGGSSQGREDDLCADGALPVLTANAVPESVLGHAAALVAYGLFTQASKHDWHLRLIDLLADGDVPLGNWTIQITRSDGALGRQDGIVQQPRDELNPLPTPDRGEG